MSNPQGRTTAASLKKWAAACPVPIPDYADLIPGAERLWPIYTAARAPDDWLQHDLVIVARLCNVETQIRANEALIRKQGAVISLGKGESRENPLFKVNETLQKQQVGMLATLAIARPSKDHRTTRNAAKKMQSLKKAFAEDDGLLAQPAANNGD